LHKKTTHELRDQTTGQIQILGRRGGRAIIIASRPVWALSNFRDLIEHFKANYKVVVPILPLFDLDIFHTSVGGLEKFVQKFIEARGYRDIHLLGNSLGGHVALVHILKHPEKIRSLTLTGSSGLFENGMGDSYPKRGDYEYIKKRPSLLFSIPIRPLRNWWMKYSRSPITG
jgi:2-hydroxy-6-oxonona-2,4-dienedioate hydrolase